MRILLADDEKTARRRLSRLLSAMPDVEFIGECSSGEELLRKLGKTEVDVLLLDIQMPGLTGLETSELVPSDGPYVIFVTAYPEHAVKAFDVGAVDYVVKPVVAARLKKALDRARAYLKNNNDLDKIAIETRNGIILIDASKLSHAEYDGYLVTLHVGDKFITTDLSLSELETRLSSQRIERVHRRHLLNLDCIERLESLETGGFTAFTRNGDEVPVSRQAARSLRKRLRI